MKRLHIFSPLVLKTGNQRKLWARNVGLGAKQHLINVLVGRGCCSVVKRSSLMQEALGSSPEPGCFVGGMYSELHCYFFSVSDVYLLIIPKTSQSMSAPQGPHWSLWEGSLTSCGRPSLFDNYSLPACPFHILRRNHCQNFQILKRLQTRLFWIRGIPASWAVVL